MPDWIKNMLFETLTILRKPQNFVISIDLLLLLRGNNTVNDYSNEKLPDIVGFQITME